MSVRRLRGLALAAVLPLSSLVMGCSGVVEDGGGTQVSDVQGGTTDTTASHNFAVGIANRLGGVCSGTLIAPNLVLTARHCVVPPTVDDTVKCTDVFPANVDPKLLYVTTEPNLFKAKSFYASSEIITPTNTAFCGNDIALVVLQKSIPASEAQPATPVVQFNMADGRLGGGITAMGYGITNPSASDSGQRRIRENIPFVCIPGSLHMDCSGDNARFAEDAAEFVTKGYVCSGDSGSGAFDQRTFNTGSPYVLGALSRGPQTAQDCLAAIYSRTDAHAKLIVDAGVKAATLGGYAAPAWTITAPGAPAPADDAPPPCKGDACNVLNAPDPSLVTPDPDAAKASGCSATGHTAPARGLSGAAVFGLALGVAFARRRRRSV